MSKHHKIITCCYCGAQAALELRGKTRHELSCGTCGAPLHALKSLKADKRSKKRSHKADPATAHPRPAAADLGLSAMFDQAHVLAKSKKRKKKSKSSYLFKKAFDAIEDIFD